MNISNANLANFVRRNGIVFATGYFQALTGQPIRNIEKESVSLEEFKSICDGDPKYNERRNTLFIARDDKGTLKGTVT